MNVNAEDIEVALIDGLRRGDPKAFSKIYNQYWRDMYCFGYRILRDEELTKDLVQDVFVTLWQRAESLEIQSTLKGYLLGAVRNRVARALTRSKLRDAYVNALLKMTEVESFGTEEQVILHELQQRIDARIERLPNRMRAVFKLSRQDGLSHREIAQHLNLSEHTVKTTVFRALTVLRSLLTIGLLLLSPLFG